MRSCETSKAPTNSVGFYVFPGLVPGPYLLVVEAAGMQKFEATLTVRVAQSAVVDVTVQSEDGPLPWGGPRRADDG